MMTLYSLDNMLGGGRLTSSVGEKHRVPLSKGQIMRKNIFVVTLVLLVALVGCAEHEHSWKVISTTEPTCSVEGENVLKCEGCGATRTERIEKLAHTFGEWKNSDDLKTNTRECSVCHETETRDGIVVNPSNAQELINSVNTGKVYFTAGEYGDLSLTHSKKVSTAKVTFTKEDADVNNLNDTTVYDYYRPIVDLELIGGDGVVIKGSFICNSGHCYGTKDNVITDPIRGTKIDSTNNSYYSHISIDGLKIEGLSLEDGIIRFDTYSLSDATVKNVTIESCSFIGVSSKDTVDQAMSFRTGGHALFENITIINSIVEKHCIGFYGQAIQNLRIEGCQFDSARNGMQIQNVGDYKFNGSVVVKGNIISNTYDRAIRFGEGNDATIAIENNTFEKAVDSDGELLKTQTLTNCTYSFIGNTYNDVPMDDVSGSDSSWVVTISTEEV